MSIHHEVERQMGGGTNKGIEASAMNMILDNLQRYQYQHPIKSTIREIVSNGIDSIAEKNMAKDILLNSTSIDKYFVSIEGAEYEDSKFDPTYYDPNYLSSDDTVNILYECGSALERDIVIINDNGVGLGSYRLEKYFNLGYSTKRLSKLPLGKFGIGGKAPLSLGIDYYIMESRYNGHLFRFNIYSHTFDSVISKFNLSTGQENPHVVFNKDTPNEYIVYYENTDKLNGVTITVSAKKNHKQQYIDAVKSQLLYFPNINFQIKEFGSEKSTTINYKAEILYENEYIVLSHNDYWSKPHLLLNKVNYGYINWEELELEDRKGNIGIKIAPEDVDVNPSRESVIWSDKTKQMVLERFANVVDIAAEAIQEELREPDYIKWMRACYSLTGRGFGENSVVGRLSKIVDISEIKPKFIPEPKLKYDSTLLGGLYIRSVTTKEVKTVNRIKTIVDRNDIRSTRGEAIHKPILLIAHDEKANNKKDKYILSELYRDGFVTITEPWITNENFTREEALTRGMTEATYEWLTAYNSKHGEESELRSLAWNYIKNSAYILWYKDIIIPDSFNTSDDDNISEVLVEEEGKDDDTDKTKKVRIAYSTIKERRKAEGKIVISTPRACAAPHGYNEDRPLIMGELPAKIYEWQRLEIPIKDMNNWDAEEIYVSGSGEEQDQLVHLIAMITRDVSPNNQLGRTPVRRNIIKKYQVMDWAENTKTKILAKSYGMKSDLDMFNCQHFFDNKEIMLIKVSQANSRYFRDFRPIEQFFQFVQDNVIVMSNILIKWNTARLIKDKLDKAKFLNNFSIFNPIYTELYKTLYKYVASNYREIEMYKGRNYNALNPDIYKDLIKHLDNIKQFQDFVATNPDSKGVSDMAQFMFGNKDIQDAQAVESWAIETLDKVLEFAEPISAILNYIPNLCGDNNNIPIELEMEIKNYLEYKGMLDYGKDEQEEKEFFQSIEKQHNIVEEVPDVDDLNIRTTHVATPPVSDMEIPENQSIYQEF